jgi:hypothetical protein
MACPYSLLAISLFCPYEPYELYALFLNYESLTLNP